MDILLIPGFWLDGSSWSRVVPALTDAGHAVHPLTLPGLESVDAPRAGIGLETHVAATVAAMDALDGPVVLVGHSGGGAIAYATIDRWPDRVARVVYVDSGPLADGEAINAELPADVDDVPLPPWDAFDAADLDGLTDELRTEFRARAIPQPRGVAADPMHLADERRLDVPSTVIACEYPSSQLEEWMAEGHPYVAELARMRDVEYVDLPTGHWPQFTRPDDLGRAILRAVERSG